LGVFKDGLDLLAADSGKPLNKLGDGRSAYKVLEKRSDRDACADEKPDSADFAGNALHR